MTVSLWRDDSTTVAVADVDVCVVGGGIAGLAIARECALRGRTCAVLEAREIASGATGRNAGFAMTGLAEPYDALVAQHGRARARSIWEVSRENLRTLVDDVVARDGIDAELTPCGSVIAAWHDNEARALARSHSLLADDGFAVAWLDHDAVASRLGSSRFRAGIGVAADCGIHPVKLARGLAAWCAAKGVSVLERHEVHAFEKAPGGRVRVRTNRGAVTATQVVVATNAYARTLVPELGSYVVPVRGQALATAAFRAVIPTLVYTDDGYQYVRQRPDGTIVAGGWRRDFVHVETGFGDEVTSGVQNGIEGFLYEAWPVLRGGCTVTHRWSGTMGFSPDGLPVIGRCSSAPVHFAVGFTGHGLGFAFAVARQVGAVLDGTGDGGSFTASRFASGA